MLKKGPWRRSLDGKKVAWKRPLSREEGPFIFFYWAYYLAGEKNEFWELVAFEKNSFLAIKSYNKNEHSEIFRVCGRRAYGAMREEAKKAMRIPTGLLP